MLTVSSRFCSPDGKCYAFDARAQGYGRGDGIAASVLKRLSTAISDGDAIRGLVRETAVNQDGYTPTLTAPSSKAQRSLIEATYARAGLDPLDTTVVEAHGTGTRAGDPVEAKAIGEAMNFGREKPLYVASVKTNLGHTEAALGLAAVIKMVMALEHRKIPPSLNFAKATPEIDLHRLGLVGMCGFFFLQTTMFTKPQIPTHLKPRVSKGPRGVSINNFGYGGTITHVIMEEAPAQSVTKCGQLPSHQLFLLSARQKHSAEQMAANLKTYIEASKQNFTDVSLFANLAYTLAERRTRFAWTVAVSASGPGELVPALESSTVHNSQSSDKSLLLGFVFNGQGAQWYAMGRELSTSYSAYKEKLEECDEIIQSFGAEWSIVLELERSKEDSRVNKDMFSMPLTCAVQVALVCLLRKFGIEATAVTGHSSGEMAAAFATGALGLHDAMAVTYFRGLLTAQHLYSGIQLTPGGMLAVGLGKWHVQPYVDAVKNGRVVVACENSPSSVTLSGDMAGIDELAATFTAQSIFAWKLVVQTAFHSHHMLPLQEKYLAALEQHMAKDKGNVLFTSPVTGTKIQKSLSLGPEHWVQNMTHPVLFHDSFRNMVATEHAGGTTTQNVDVVVEVGPHSALSGLIRQCLQALSTDFSVGYAACLERGKDAVLTMQNLAGFLFCHGHLVNTSYVNSPEAQKGLQVIHGLPSYAWNHTQRFWQESRISEEHRFHEHPQHDLLGVRVTGTSDQSPIWRQVVRPREVRYVHLL